MKLLLIYETVQDMLDKLSDRYNTSVERIKAIISEISDNPKDSQFILKLLYNNYQSSPRLREKYDISVTLDNFHKVKKFMDNKDLLSYKTLDELNTAINRVAGKVSKRKGGSDTDVNMPGVKVFAKLGDYVTYEISTIEALMKMGEGTKWCTRGSYTPCNADAYISDNDRIYQIWENNKPIVQFTKSYSEIKDSDNTDIDIPQFVDIVPNYIDDYEKYQDSPIMRSLSTTSVINYMKYVYQRQSDKFENILSNAAQRIAGSNSNRNLKSQLLYSMADEIGQYCYHYNKGSTVPLLEPIIKLYPYSIVAYAIASGRRFEEGEEVLFQKVNVECITRYLERVMNNERWPGYEELLYNIFVNNQIYNITPAECGKLLYYYSDATGVRFEEYETKLVAISPMPLLFNYLRDVVRSRWPALEERINNYVEPHNTEYLNKYNNIIFDFTA